jgi:hypothetical protein
MTGNMWWGAVAILLGCLSIGLGVANGLSQQKERPNDPTYRRWSRAEARLWMGSTGVWGIGYVCLGVTMFRNDSSFGLVASVFLTVGSASILSGLLRGRFAVTRTHDNRFREGR